MLTQKLHTQEKKKKKIHYSEIFNDYIIILFKWFHKSCSNIIKSECLS